MANFETATGNWPATLQFLDHVAPSELRVVCGMAAGVQEGGYTTWRLAATVLALQDKETAWSPPDGARSINARVQRTVSDGGIATLVDPSESAQLWETNEANRELLLALGGLFTAWSLDNPRLSQGKFLDYDPLHERWARIDFGIYQALLGYPVVRAGGLKDGKLTDQQLQRRIQMGVVRPLDNEEAEPTFVMRGRARQGQTIEMRALYKGTRTLAIGEVVTLSELLNRALDAEPQLDSGALRSFILERIRPNTGHLARQDGDSTQPTLDTVTLSPDLEGPIAQIVDEVQRIAEGGEVTEYAAKAREFIATPSVVSQMIKKWRQFSTRGPRSSS